MAVYGSSLCYKVGLVDGGKILQLSCSCIDGFKKLNHFFPPNPKQNRMFLATAYSGRHYRHLEFCSRRTCKFVRFGM
uniref:Uncharacterized protein n=1 Tax=Rhizophora mucronata TaxID=61149 RepID=A0A2P2IRC0_RHIMU